MKRVLIIGALLIIFGLTYSSIKYRFLKTDNTIDTFALNREIEYLNNEHDELRDDIDNISTRLQVSSLTVNNYFYPPRSASLPSTGYEAGAIYYETDTWTFWGATETVTGIQSWIQIGKPGD